MRFQKENSKRNDNSLGFETLLCYFGVRFVETPCNKSPESILIEMLSYPITTSSQHQQLLQLLRDCCMVLPQTLLLLYVHHVKHQILFILV